MLRLLAVLTLAFSLNLAAQVNGRLTGSVVDPSGAPVPAAKVEVFLRGGASALLQTVTNESGIFAFSSLRPEAYDISVTLSGFAQVALRAVKIDSLKETSLGPIKLEVASAAQVVEVSAEAQGVQLGNSELVTTISRDQVANLPTASRQLSSLFATQAGVSDGRGPTAINGLRTSAANVTLDGVNIQDNFIRTNALDFMPIRPTVDQISELSIAIGNAGSTVGGGSAQISLITRSGTNQLHGSGYWFNQNEAYNANEFFNNRSGTPKPKLNQNQVGVSLGGKIIKDKLFYFGNFESLRLKQQNTQIRTVLVPEARNGNFLYRTAPGQPIQSVNVLAARNLTIDPTIRAMIASLPLPNNSDAGDGIITRGYRFNAQANTIRDQFVNRWDYYLNSSNSFFSTYNRTSEYNDRPDINTRFYDAIPPNNTDTTRNFLSVGWRSTLSPTLTNELRGGFLRSPSLFGRSDAVPSTIVNPSVTANTAATAIFTFPTNPFLPQGRRTRTYSIQDNANWLKGKHDISFGFQSQLTRNFVYNDGGTIPQATLGISAANPNGLSSAQLPGITGQDLTRANDYLATLAGFVTNATQTFFVNDATAGFAKGVGERRNFSNDTHALYFQDRWKIRPRLTLTLGLRYEYWTVLKESNNLFLLPNSVGGNIISTILNPNASFDFVNKNERSLYRPDRNNFAPTIGFAWDPFGKGKTAIRGSYGIAFFNDDALTAIRNSANTNGGLNTVVTQLNLNTTLAAVPSLSPATAFATPITLPSLYQQNRQVALGSPEFNLASPYAQNYTFGIQHDFKGTIVEARYVGNHGTKLLRAYDYNQVDIINNGFLADFRRVQAGTQATFPGLSPGFNVNAAANQQLIRQGEVGTLAANTQINNQQGSVNFFRNPNALAANVIGNGANSTYNALQIDVRRQVRGLLFQSNYTWSKVLSDTTGDTQERFEPFLDFGNGALERARAPFDLRHSFKTNATYQLPFGAGKRFSGNRAVNHVIGGWTVSGTQSWLSGFPFNVLSQRGTLNRGPRSTGRNTATTNLTYEQITSNVFALNKRDGVTFINDGFTLGGRAVNTDGVAPYPNQPFFNPTAGNVGNLQRRMFSGPTSFFLDMSLKKQIAITERHSLQFGVDAFNLPNHPSFFVGVDQDINSVNFNRITGVNGNGARFLQFSLYYRF